MSSSGQAVFQPTPIIQALNAFSAMLEMAGGVALLLNFEHSPAPTETTDLRQRLQSLAAGLQHLANAGLKQQHGQWSIDVNASLPEGLLQEMQRQLLQLPTTQARVHHYTGHVSSAPVWSATAWAQADWQLIQEAVTSLITQQTIEK